MPPVVARPAAGGGEHIPTDLALRHQASGYGIAHVSFTLTRGSVVVLCGRIGSGKSTLLRALLGLLVPDAGDVRWTRRRVAEPASFFVPPRAAYAPQAPCPMSGTLRENVLLGPPNGEGLARAAGAAARERDVDGFPGDLETVIGARRVRLSGGQAQRTAAARKFARDAELLVFDDLSSALDVGTERLLWRRLFERDVTCLIASHRRAVLERALQILVLEGGCVTARGRLDELLQTSAEMRRLYTVDEFPEREVRPNDATP